MPAAGIAGAIYDPAASQDTGALCTGIGFGTKSVVGPGAAAALDKNFTDGVSLVALRIGGGSQAINAIGETAGKGLTMESNTNAAGGASIANGAAMSGTTSLNKTGSAVPPGGMCLAVAP